MDIQSYLDTLKSYEPSMIRTRRDLHRHAETGWLEYRTTALLIKKLKEHGIPVKYGKEIINKDYLWAYPSETVRKSAIDRALNEGADPEIIKEMDGFTGLCAVIETGKPGPMLALRFDIDCNGWQVQGSFMEWDYQVTEPCGALVATVTKELFHWTDTYVIDVVNPADALRALMLVLAIDAEKCSRDH